jgi:hypothetical protein
MALHLLFMLFVARASGVAPLAGDVVFSKKIVARRPRTEDSQFKA